MESREWDRPRDPAPPAATIETPPPPPAGPRRRLGLQIVLFVLTVASTALVGGPAYSASLMAILLCHEMGHFLAARYYGVPATLPFFIPFPLSPFGTFGAVIKMGAGGRIPDRRALFDIGILGPAAGLAVALPVTVLGIAHSRVVPVAGLGPDVLPLGDSLLFALLTHWLHGPLPPGQDLLLGPVAFAGWAGLFVTALNLLPLGQLDGGHVVHALFGRRSRWVYRAVFVAFALFALAWNPQWIFFLVLVFFVLGLRHPPTGNEARPLGGVRTALGVLALVVFLSAFPPVPIPLGS